jgi:hypothetical protein
VIAKTLDDLPSEIPTEVIAKAEETLVGHCAQFGPRQLLCSHHHHRAHDPTYDAHRLPTGDVRFTRRT